MSNEIRHLNSAAITFAILFAASNSAAMMCKNVLKPVKAKPSQNEIVPLKEKASSSKAVQLAPEIALKSKEQIHLQDQFSQFPNTNVISSSHIASFVYENNQHGDTVRVKLYTKGDPRKSADPTLTINGTQDRATLLLQQMMRNRDNLQASQVRNEVQAPIPTDYNTRTNILRKYVQDVISTPSNPLDSTAVEFIVSTLHDNAKTLRLATDYAARVERQGEFMQNVTLLTLSNRGAERYFRFTPEGQHNEVNARVLDIHRVKNPYSLILLIEWMGTELADGTRVRHIETFKSSDLATVRDITEQERTEASIAFQDSLSPNEINTRKLAKKMGINTFGYTTKDRLPEAYTTVEGYDPLSQMANITHLAVQAWTKDRFGAIEDLLLPEERGQTLLNVMDVMARLNPRYVLQRFLAKGDGWQYAFVITEDGQLKVSPHGHQGNNLKPQILRLAHGRRIYAGGTFTINSKGEITATLESTTYQDHDSMWGGQDAFHTAGNGKVEDFIVKVFALQTGFYVNQVGARPTETYRTADSRAYRDSHNDREQTFNDEFENAQSFAQKNTNNPNPSHAKKIAWNVEDTSARPLNFEDWVVAAGRKDVRPQSVETEWAHYVLNTTSDMSLSQIKKVYRKLMMRFHADKNPQWAQSDAGQTVNSAFDIIDRHTK